MKELTFQQLVKETNTRSKLYLMFQDLYTIEQYLQKQMPCNHIATLQYIHFQFPNEEEEYIKFVQISHHLNGTPVFEQSLMYESTN